jgi:hypothetical protein
VVDLVGHTIQERDVQSMFLVGVFMSYRKIDGVRRLPEKRETVEILRGNFARKIRIVLTPSGRHRSPSDRQCHQHCMKKFVSPPISYNSIRYFVIGKVSIIPVSLRVGRQTDHTVLLEGAAEGILLFHLVSMLVFLSLSAVQLSLSTTKFVGRKVRATGNSQSEGIVDVPECRRADRTSEA